MTFYVIAPAERAEEVKAHIPLESRDGSYFLRICSGLPARLLMKRFPSERRVRTGVRIFDADQYSLAGLLETLELTRKD